MTRYRCTHCRTVFVGGELRDCCLPASVAEQKRLRSLVEALKGQGDRPETGFTDLLRSMNLIS